MNHEQELNDSSYSHVLKYTGIFGGVQGLNIIISLVRNKLVAVILGPDGMGLTSLFNTTVNFLSQATNFGIPFSAVKHVSELYDQHDEAQMSHYIRVIRVWSLLTALLGMLLCVLLGPFLSNYAFSWGDHTLHFVLLSPAIGLMAITGGETAILKGTRQLNSLAAIQVVNVFMALVISIPLYYFFGQSGIVPVIVLMALASMLLTIGHSYRLFPLRLKYSGCLFGEGLGMVKLGVAFVLAGVMGSAAEMFIRSYLNVVGGLEVVGLYNAGFMLTITYAGLVFSAMETDFFPRLSSVNSDVAATNLTVNRQIEVSLLIISPMLVGFIILLPVLIPLLFSGKFLPMVSMAQVAVFSMYIKAISLPVSYIMLARGDSVAFMVLEAVYDVVLVLFVMFGYSLWGLFGTGVALSLSYVFDIVMVATYARLRYQYRISVAVIHYAAIQLALCVAAYIVTFIDNQLMYWVLGAILSLVSLQISITILHQKTSLWSSLVTKFKDKFRRHA